MCCQVSLFNFLILKGPGQYDQMQIMEVSKKDNKNTAGVSFKSSSPRLKLYKDIERQSSMNTSNKNIDKSTDNSIAIDKLNDTLTK